MKTPLMTLASKALLRRKHRSRGAAMVEAAVVLPMLCMFLGIMTFARAQYSAQLYTMADARQKTWDNASHGCVSGGEEGTSLDVPDPPGNTTQKVINPGPSQAAKEEGIVKIVRKTSAGATATTSLGQYSGGAGSTSYVFCNEENYGEGAIGMLTGFVNFVSSFWRTGVL